MSAVAPHWYTRVARSADDAPMKGIAGESAGKGTAASQEDLNVNGERFVLGFNGHFRAPGATP